MTTEQILLLAIDTSTEQTGIALYDGTCLDEVVWSSCREHTVVLLDEIDHQLGRSKVEAAGIGAVAVATGPGRFNALRVGMSIAKGLVLGLDIPIIGIPTLEAIAYPWRGNEMPVAAVIDAGRGRIAWQWFDAHSQQRPAEPQNTSIEALVASIPENEIRICVTGEISETLEQELRAIPGVFIPPLAGRLGRAASIAELAFDRLQRGETDDAATLEPVYLHGLRRTDTASSGS